MPNIYDNIELPLLPVLQGSMKMATHADFCVGYFNLRGWGALSDQHIPASELAARLAVREASDFSDA